MNAGELKKLLKDVPNHFEVAASDKPLGGTLSGIADLYFAFRDEKGIKGVSVQRFKRANMLMFIVPSEQS